MILLVEPNGQISTVLERLLCRNGFPVRTARNGCEGLTLARECRPRLMVCSDYLPDVSANELRAIMRSDPELRDLPVVFCRTVVSPEVTEMLDRIEQAYYEAPPMPGIEAMPLTYRPFARL